MCKRAHRNKFKDFLLNARCKEISAMEIYYENTNHSCRDLQCECLKVVGVENILIGLA